MEDLSLTCPITLEVFHDPVRLVGDRSNTVFERQAIEEWLENHSTVPTTGEEIGMAGRKIVEDMEMRRRVEEVSKVAETKGGGADEIDGVVDGEDNDESDYEETARKPKPRSAVRSDGGELMRREGKGKTGVYYCCVVGCGYKGKDKAHVRRHQAYQHDIGVVWQHCTVPGCGFKAKQKGNMKKHEANVHDMNVKWHHCTVPGCGYKAKEKSNLKRHVRGKHSDSNDAPPPKRQKSGKPNLSRV